VALQVFWFLTCESPAFGVSMTLPDPDPGLDADPQRDFDPDHGPVLQPGPDYGPVLPFSCR
jgi:hypothetical protein